MNNQPVSFPAWKDALSQSDLPAAAKVAFAREVIGFLKHCKKLHAPATAGLAKQYLEHHEKSTPGPARMAVALSLRPRDRVCFKMSLRGGPRLGATKQSSLFDKLKVPSLSRDWITTSRSAGLVMTDIF